MDKRRNHATNCQNEGVSVIKNFPELHPDIRAYWEQQGFDMCLGSFIWFAEKEIGDRNTFQGMVAFADGDNHGKLKYRLNEEDYNEAEDLRVIRLIGFW